MATDHGATPWLRTTVLYTLVAAAVLGPSWWGASGLMVGGGDDPDSIGTAWTFWTTAQALARGASPARVTSTWFPVGTWPLSQYNFLDAILATPLVWLLGLRRAYNVFAGLCLVGTALGAHALARVARASHVAATAAGLGLLTSTFLCQEMEHGRLSQALLVFWLLALAGLVRLSRGEGGWKLAVATGLAVAATHYAYWYYGLFLSMAAVMVFTADARHWTRAVVGRVALAAATALAAVGPAVLAMWRHFAELPGVQRPLEPWLRYGDFGRGEFALSMVTHYGHRPPWPLLHLDTDQTDQRLALGLLALALVGLARSRQLRWLALALLGYLLALGPWLKGSGGQPLPYRLPWLYLYDHLPFFSRLWWPDRAIVLTMAGLAVLAALGVDAVRQRWPRVAWLAVALVLADIPLRHGTIPVDATRPQDLPAEVYGALDGPVLTTPVLANDDHDRAALWAQTVHEQPVLTGLGAHLPGHRPPRYEAYVAGNALLAALAELDTGRGGATIRPEAVQELVDDGFAWAVVDPASWPPGEHASVQAHRAAMAALWGAPDLSADGVQAWRIRPLAADATLPRLGSGHAK